MKKTIVTITLFLGINNFSAQETKNLSNFLPAKGDWALTFNANGVFRFIGNAFNNSDNISGPSLSSPIDNTFVGKYFIKDKQAYRVALNIGLEKSKNSGFIFGVNDDSKIETSNFNLSLGFGKEWRRGITKFQGFYGADVLITGAQSSTSVFSKNTVTNVVIDQTGESGFKFGIGLSGFIGIEYFILPKMALLAQYTYNVRYQPETTTKVESSETGKPTKKLESTSSELKIGNFSVGSIGVTFQF